MVLFMCLDNQNGISFNHRRQSADRCIYERILNRIEKNTLWVRNCSRVKFPADRITVVAQFEHVTDPDAWCFAEDDSVLAILEQFETIIVYRWNRDYPSDVVFPQSCLDMYQLSASVTFKGNSHDMITEELYRK